VGWLQPVQLSGTAVRVVLSQLFGGYLDKRELQNVLAATVHDESAGGELWFDYVADLGDGFDATYSIAYLLGQPSLAVDELTLPRGRMLIMGGDEVYPTASATGYEDRTKGPYQAAFPTAPLGEQPPSLYALPGNHDWYDGLTAFLRLFVKNGTDHIGAWRNEQSRSYFAVRLPQGWWLFAIDTQFGTYIDEPQLHYFRAAAAAVSSGDRIILCAPTPGWVEATKDKGAYDAIDYFVRTILGPTGAEVRLMLSGDLHHYAHYTGEDRELVHCGGGGAYLYGTHELPHEIQVPPPESLSLKRTQSKLYRLVATYPSAAASRAYAAGVFTRLPWRNKGFVALIGILHLMLMLSIVEVMRHPTGAIGQILYIPLVVVGLLVLAATTFFAMPPTAGQRGTRHWLFGVGHGIAHIGLGVLGAWLWNHTAFINWGWPLPLIMAIMIYLPIVGIVATELVCLYLLVAGTAGVNFNELYAGQGIDESKSFLRIHIDSTGDLTIYPIAVDRVGRKWTPQPKAPADSAWLTPASPLVTRLAQPPIVIR
jgi:hypothetical protein